MLKTFLTDVRQAAMTGHSSVKIAEDVAHNIIVDLDYIIFLPIDSAWI